MPIRFGFGLPGPFYYTSGDKHRERKGGGWAVLAVLALSVVVVAIIKMIVILAIGAATVFVIGLVVWSLIRGLHKWETEIQEEINARYETLRRELREYSGIPESAYTNLEEELDWALRVFYHEREKYRYLNDYVARMRRNDGH